MLGKGNASALYVTPVFPKGTAHDQYTYGRAPWWRQRYEAASAVGHATQQAQWTSDVSAVREFSHGFVAANGHALGSPPLVVQLPAGKQYKDLSTRQPVSGTLSVLPRNATVLLLVVDRDEVSG